VKGHSEVYEKEYCAAKLGIYQYDVPTGTILWDARVRELWGVGAEGASYLRRFSRDYIRRTPQTRALLDRALDPRGNGEYYSEFVVLLASNCGGRDPAFSPAFGTV